MLNKDLSGSQTPAALDDSAIASSTSEREPVQILIVGSPKGITKIVQTFHRLGFAEVNEWSLLLPAPIPGKLMRVLTRRIFK